MNYTTVADTLAPAMPTEGILFSVDSLYAALHTVTDKRHARGKLYPLAPLLTIAVLAKLMGKNQITEIAQWCQERAAAVTTLCGLKRATLPHVAPWTRLFAHAIDPTEYERRIGNFFAAQLQREIPQRGELIVAIDGKTVRGTIPHGAPHGVHLMAACVPHYGVVVAQVAVDGKENAIGAAPRLVAQRDLRGMGIVGDAMQAQRALRAQIVADGGDYVWLVKENQPSLLTDSDILCTPEPFAKGASAAPTDFQAAVTYDIGHGRIEKRGITVRSALADDSP